MSEFGDERLRILCFGNPLHGDDGFGQAVCLALQALSLGPGVQVIDAGVRGLDALVWFEGGAEILIVDALAGEEAGRLHELTADEVACEGVFGGGHGAGVGHLLAAAREVCRPLPKITLLLAEVVTVRTFAPGLSLPVAVAVALAVERIRTGWPQAGGRHQCELRDELEVLREAKQALESELTVTTETLEQLIDEQELQKDALQQRSGQLLQLLNALERAVDTMAEIFVLLGPDGRILRANRAFFTDLAYPPEALVGSFLEACLSDSAHGVLQSLEPGSRGLLDVIRASSGGFEAELSFLHNNGTTSLPYLVRASLMHGRAGKLEGAVVVASNIAQLKAREEALCNNERLLSEANEELCLHRDNLVDMVDARTRELSQAKDQAEAASRAKGDFLSNMSHELRTPLNAIIGLSDLCLLAEPSPQQEQYLTKIGIAADHLLGIINDILDFSRIEAGRMSVEQVAFDMAVLLEEVSDLMIGRIEEKGLELIVDLAPDAGRAFVGDPLRLKQVILNLLGNAIKFSDKGDLRLNCRLLDVRDGLAELHFSVSDEGIGISPEQQAALFSAFTQADSSTSRRFGGSGLGLAISRRIVELMDGRIWISSVLGQGSTFHFTVRLGWDAGHASWAERLQGYLRSFAGKAALIVTDHRQIGASLADQCRQLGLQAESMTHAQWRMAAAPEWGEACLAVFMHGSPLDCETSLSVLARRPGAPAAVLLASQIFLSHPALSGEPGAAGFAARLAKPSSVRRVYAALAGLFALPKIPAKVSAVRRLDVAAYTHLRGVEALVVDDVDLNQDLMTDLLTTVGLKVRLAGNGERAIAEIRKRRPDIVLMDCQMPVMDGFTATRYLRGLPEYADLPIVALTAGAMDRDRADSRAAGMDAHVTKPVVFDKLMLVIDQLLRRRSRVADISPQLPPHHAAAASTGGTLPLLPGIDTTEGLRFTGNKIDFYLRMLRKFRDTIAAGFAAEMQRLQAEGQVLDAVRLAHTLKGAARNLGIGELGDLAAAVEAELRQTDGKALSLPRLLAELAQIHEVLREL